MSDTNRVWVKICSLNEVPKDRAKGFSVNGQQLILVQCSDNVQVMQGLCSHMWFPLANSKVEDCKLTCGLHHSTFAVEDGSVQEWSTFPPLIGAALAVIKQSKGLRVYPTRIENEAVYLEWAASDPSSVKVRL